MKALFIGNSHTFYNDMPQTFARLYEESMGEQVDTVLLVHASAYGDYLLACTHYAVVTGKKLANLCAAAVIFYKDV